jgi:hypothetical protein
MLLASEIEKEIREREENKEKIQKSEDASLTTTATTVVGEEHGATIGTASINGENVANPEAKVEVGSIADGEGDVTMEER